MLKYMVLSSCLLLSFPISAITLEEARKLTDEFNACTSTSHILNVSNDIYGYNARVYMARQRIDVNLYTIESSTKTQFAALLAHEYAHTIRYNLRIDIYSNWTEEYKADELGVDILRKCGYNGNEMLELLSRISKGGKSHPKTSDRIKNIKAKRNVK